MRARPHHKTVLPDGELKRFRLPEVMGEPAVDLPLSRGRRWLYWIVPWALLTFVCFQWSEGRLGVRSWIGDVSGRLVPSEPVAGVRDGARPVPRSLPIARDDDEPTRVVDSTRVAAIVSAPTGTASSVDALPIHRGSFDVVTQKDEPERDTPNTSAVQASETLSARGVNVYAGPGCEGAKRRFREGALVEKEDPEVVRLLGKRSLYDHCKPELSMLRICALVHQGKAEGVTVQTEPPNRPLGTCAAIVAKTLSYPKTKGPQLVKAEVYFR